jgi:hypothetical protein
MRSWVDVSLPWIVVWQYNCTVLIFYGVGHDMYVYYDVIFRRVNAGQGY